jgi:hypothetical protein
MFFASILTKPFIMQKIFLSLLFLGLSLTLLAQSETEAVIQSFKTASVEEIAGHFDDFVDLKLLDKDEIKNMSKNQATITLKAFFSENGIKGFDKVSEGGKGTLAYLIGKLTTANKSYNITIQMKQKAAKMQIITIRIS